jgi:hypothetical protein
MIPMTENVSRTAQHIMKKKKADVNSLCVKSVFQIKKRRNGLVENHVIGFR